ncbi:Y4yA family PLP-dependent enzyme [Nocardia acididurans]|nr:Y4yA family PLP-dependent enzyme [Nocardia acididurans]
METTPVPDISPIAAAPMRAHRDEWEERLLEHPEKLYALAAMTDGPFHVMYPGRVGRNIQGFRAAFENAQVNAYAIYYGKKANKAACVVTECVKHGAGVDVSSIAELDSALRGLVAGRDLVVTGPAKSDELLRRAAHADALITLDAPDELLRVLGLGIPARVTLRVRAPGSQSRFGMDDAQLDWATAKIAEAQTTGKRILLEGFSFHLSGYRTEPRARLAHRLIDRCLAARAHCPEVSMISIGGGFGVDYVAAADWKTFREEMTDSWFHAGRMPAPDNLYPYHFENPGPGMLTEILLTEQAESGRTLADRLNEHRVRLAIEPGRALLDRAGSTVFRVQGVKELDADGHRYLMLTADGTSLSLSEQWFASEYLPDPELVSPPGSAADAALPACVGGASCLEDDMISWRRIPLPRRARPGDLLVYPNTAGYQMDSNESAFHQLPVPRKIVLRDNADGGFAVEFDEVSAVPSRRPLRLLLRSVIGWVRPKRDTRSAPALPALDARPH